MVRVVLYKNYARQVPVDIFLNNNYYYEYNKEISFSSVTSQACINCSTTPSKNSTHAIAFD